MRFVSHAISYSSCIVWRAKYAATGCSMAFSSSSGAVFCENSVQSRSVSAPASMPSSSAMRPVSVVRLGTRALPPRSPNETQPSLHGQISRVRPMLAPRRAPR